MEEGPQTSSSSSTRIPDFNGEMVVKEQDVSAVRSAITREANVFALIENMTLEQLDNSNDVLSRYPRSGLSDFVLKALIKHDLNISEMEV